MKMNADQAGQHQVTIHPPGNKQDSTMLVAVVEPVGGHGGMNYYDFGLARGLTMSGAMVTLYTCDETTVPENAVFCVKRYFRGVYGSDKKLFRAWRFLVGQLTSLIDARSAGVGVVHFHLFGASILELFAVVFARVMSLRVVVTAHDVESFNGKGLLGTARLVYRFTDIVITHNAVSQRELIGKIQIRPDKVAVVPHGNYIENMETPSWTITDSKAARRRLGLSEDRLVVLFFGQIKEVKGLDILLSALARTVRSIPEIQVVIAGRVWRDDFSRYERIIQAHNLGGHVIKHIRYIPDDEARDYFCSADIVVLPYRRIYQSGVLLMAMSYQRPVLVSDLQGMTDIVQDNVNGFVFRTGDANHLGERLVELLADSLRLNTVAREGYETARRDHDWERIGRLTMKLYRTACRTP